MDQVTAELKQLFHNLKDRKFSGEGTGTNYPPGDQHAYYRMRYSPGQLELRHKSPSASSEETFVVQYRNRDDYNFTRIDCFADGIHQTTYTERDPRLFSENASNEGLQFLIKYLFKDPRVVLSAAESVCEVFADEGTKRYRVTALDIPAPILGLKVVVEFLVAEGILKSMYIRKFLGDKEIVSQNMEVEFTFEPATA